MLTRWVREVNTVIDKVFAGSGTPKNHELARLKRGLALVTKERVLYAPRQSTLPRNHLEVHGDPMLAQSVLSSSHVSMPSGLS